MSLKAKWICELGSYVAHTFPMFSFAPSEHNVLVDAIVFHQAQNSFSDIPSRDFDSTALRLVCPMGTGIKNPQLVFYLLNDNTQFLKEWEIGP